MTMTRSEDNQREVITVHYDKSVVTRPSKNIKIPEEDCIPNRPAEPVSNDEAPIVALGNGAFTLANS